MSGQRNLVWVTLDKAGSDPSTCRIADLAAIVTNGQLVTVAEGPRLAIAERGLQRADAEMLAFVQQHCAAQTAPLCGDAIWRDRPVLKRLMPAFHDYLHYRNIDVATVTEVARRWFDEARWSRPIDADGDALVRARATIERMRWYRAQLFVPAESSA